MNIERINQTGISGNPVYEKIIAKNQKKTTNNGDQIASLHNFGFCLLFCISFILFLNRFYSCQ